MYIARLKSIHLMCKRLCMYAARDKTCELIKYKNDNFTMLKMSFNFHEFSAVSNNNERFFVLNKKKRAK